MPYDEVMHKWKSGTLHSGGAGGPKVTNQKQAIAIMLSEKHKAASGDAEYAAKNAAVQGLHNARPK